MGRHFVSHGKLGKSGQLIKAIGNSNLNAFPDMDIEQNHKTETEENQLFAFPRNIQQLMVNFVSENVFIQISLLGKRRNGRYKRFWSSDQGSKGQNIIWNVKIQEIRGRSDHSKSAEAHRSLNPWFRLNAVSTTMFKSRIHLKPSAYWPILYD